MSQRLVNAFEHRVNRLNEIRESQIRHQTVQRRLEAEAAVREVGNQLHDGEPTASQTRRDTPPEVPPRPPRRAPQPQPPTTPPASLLEGYGEGGEGDVNSEETIRDLQDQLHDRAREYEQSMREIGRMNIRINELEGELRDIRESEVEAIDQARLADANTWREQYYQLREVLERAEAEQREAVRRRNQSENESEELRRQLRRAQAELQEQRLAVVDDARTIGRSSIGQTISSGDRRSERGSQQRYPRGYGVRSTWESGGRLKHEFVRPLRTREAYLMGA